MALQRSLIAATLGGLPGATSPRSTGCSWPGATASGRCRPTKPKRELRGHRARGGGNRCYWQGNSLEALWAAHPFVLVSSWASAGRVPGGVHAGPRRERVRPLVDEACRTTPRNVEWARLLQRRSIFPVGEMYPALLTAVFGEAELARLRAGPELLIKIARPPRAMPIGLATAAGLLGYQLEKFATNRVHPRIGRRLGFRAEFVSTHAVRDTRGTGRGLVRQRVRAALHAGGAGGGRGGARWRARGQCAGQSAGCLRGGGRADIGAGDARYKALPDVPNRVYVQPSQPIGVNKFAVTDGEGIRVAYRLGLADGAAFAASLRR